MRILFIFLYSYNQLTLLYCITEYISYLHFNKFGTGSLPVELVWQRPFQILLSLYSLGAATVFQIEFINLESRESIEYLCPCVYVSMCCHVGMPPNERRQAKYKACQLINRKLGYVLVCFALFCLARDTGHGDCKSIRNRCQLIWLIVWRSKWPDKCQIFLN